VGKGAGEIRLLFIMAKIKIGKERELKFTLLALDEINKKYGSVADMQKKLSSGKDPLSLVPDVVFLITMLANQAIIERNMDIEMGEIVGDKEKLLTEEYVKIKLDMGQIINMKESIFGALVDGMKFTVDVTAETDEVLAEIDAAKNA